MVDSWLRLVRMARFACTIQGTRFYPFSKARVRPGVEAVALSGCLMTLSWLCPDLTGMLRLGSVLHSEKFSVLPQFCAPNSYSHYWVSSSLALISSCLPNRMDVLGQAVACGG